MMHQLFKDYLQTPAEPINPWLTRLTAGLWLGAFSGIFATGILLDSPDNPYSAVAVTILCIFFTIIGACYAHRLLQWPHVDYLQSRGSLANRMIAMIWFGILSEILMSSPIISYPGWRFVSLLAATMGFSLGYRILLLPNTLKAIIKVAMISLIGTSAVVFFISFMVVFMLLLAATNSASHMNFLTYINAFSGSMLSILFGSVVFSMITYPWVLLGSLCLHFTSVLFKKIRI